MLKTTPDIKISFLDTVSQYVVQFGRNTSTGLVRGCLNRSPLAVVLSRRLLSNPPDDSAIKLKRFSSRKLFNGAFRTLNQTPAIRSS